MNEPTGLIELPWRLLAGGAGILLACAGCTTVAEDNSRPVYTASQSGQVIKQDAGEIISIEEVLIKAPSSNAGSTGTGAQIGRAVGAGVLSGNPGAIIGAVGGVMGASAGARMDDKIGDKITIRLDTGEVVSIVQERGKGAPLMPGERVVIESGSSVSVYGGGNSRVHRAIPTKNYFAATVADRRR